jgi:hypothetical protein
MKYNQFKPGDKVKYVGSIIYTVINQLGCQVWIDDGCGGWIHPNKLTLIK